MPHTLIHLSEDAFAALYPLRTNPLNPAASWTHADGGGCLFETYGEELAFVRGQDPLTVWTLIDEDGAPHVLSGFHRVNRIGYLISTVPVPEGHAFKVPLPAQSAADAEAPTHTVEPWDCDGCTILYATPDESDAMAMLEVRANVTDDGWDTVAFIEATWPGCTVNARRIAACVNACKGIPAEALEQGVIAELLQALTACRNYLADDLDESDETETRIFRHACAALARAQGGAQ